MKKNKRPPTRPVAEELSEKEIEKLLLLIGKAVKAHREKLTTLEAFAYEINISRSAMTKYEAGGDMYLSTFLKLIHGLDVPASELFKGIK